MELDLRLLDTGDTSTFADQREMFITSDGDTLLTLAEDTFIVKVDFTA